MQKRVLFRKIRKNSNKNVPDDVCLDLDDLMKVNGGNMENEIETNQTTPVSDPTINDV